MTHAQTTPIGVLSTTCPLCHTVGGTVTPDSLRNGATWVCTRCAQSWTAARVETAAAYAQFASARLAAVRDTAL